MSASRTLLRRITKVRVELPDGQVVFADVAGRPRRVRPGTFNRRLRVLWKAGHKELSLHATKGLRLRTVA